MNLTDQQINLIKKYMRDELSDKESITFNDQIKQEEFKNALIDHANILYGMELGEDKILRDRLNYLSTHSNAKTESKNQPSSTRNNRSKKNILLLFLITGLLIVLFFFFQKVGSESHFSPNIYAEHYQKYPIDDLQRSDVSSSDKLLDNTTYLNAMAAYANAQYKTSLDLLNQIEMKDERLLIYKATCQIELNNLDNAIEILNQLQGSSIITFKQSSDWYLTIAYLKQDNETQVEKYLNLILSEKGHLYIKEAQKLKQAIN